MILKQVIYFKNTNSVEATWEDDSGNIVKCHSYADVQMDMLRADLGNDALEYEAMILEVESMIASPAPKTAEQLITEWKSNRQALVDNIEVTYNGVIYQGDETSQTRMTRAIIGLPNNTTTINWVAKDNSEHPLNKVDLSVILLDAGTQQSAIWNAGRP